MNHHPIKALGAMLIASSRKRVTASPEMMEYGKRLAKEFWEAKDRMAHRQSRIDRLKNDLQSEYQRDKDDERNGDWTR